MTAQLNFDNFKKDDQLSIQEAASLLGTSTKTLRRWEARGIVTPQRTVGNQRRYTRDQIKRLKDPALRMPVVVNYLPAAPITPKSGPNLSKFVRLLIPAIASIAIFTAVVYLNHQGLSKSPISEFELSEINHDSRVLAENTALTDYIFQINVPSLFSQSATFSAGITAPNVIYDLNAGTGISISTGQTPTISLNTTDLSSFGTIKVGSTEIDAGISGDTFTVAAGSNVSISTDTTNKKITISSTDTTGLTGTIPIGNGGTNITTYTAGDILYASAADTLVKLPIGSAGKILTVTSGLPSWESASSSTGAFTATGGIVDKTTVTDRLRLLYGDLSDVQLEINNTTNTAGAPTADSVQLNLTDGAGITTDNVDGIYINLEGGNGTSSDVSALHLDFDPVSGSSDDTFSALLVDGITGTSAQENAISIGSGWDIDISLADTSPTIAIGNTGTLSITDGSNTLLSLVDDGSSGRLGIGLTPVSKLDVQGAVVGKALVSFDETGDQNILTASASGVTVFNLERDGDVLVASGKGLDTITGGLVLGGTNASSVSLCNSATCDTLTLATNTDADTITIGEANDNISITEGQWSITTAGAASFGTFSSTDDWTWTATTPNITINDNETFTIVDAATVDTFTINTSGSLFSYTDGTNSFTFDVDSGPVYAGTARPSKKITLVPEYPGAVFTPDGGSNVGTLTSDFCSEDGLRNVNSNASPTDAAPCDNDVAGEEHNYYTWTSSSATQDYDLWVRWQVPMDFAAFASSDAIQAYGWRTDGTNVVEISLFDTAGAADATSVNVATGTAAWTLTDVDDAPGGTYTQGSYVTFKIHLANDTALDDVKVGEIIISYLARF